MLLTVHVPDSYPAERRYAINVLLGEFLGLEYDVVAWGGRVKLSVNTA